MMKAYENLQMCDDEFVEQFTARVTTRDMIYFDGLKTSCNSYKHHGRYLHDIV
jgi:hypothetical protein